jgi:hypothetical protein
MVAIKVTVAIESQWLQGSYWSLWKVNDYCGKSMIVIKSTCCYGNSMVAIENYWL